MGIGLSRRLASFNRIDRTAITGAPYISLHPGARGWTEPCARLHDRIANVELNAMNSTTNPPNLPSVLAKLLQPWLDVVEQAPTDSGLEVMKVAAEVVMNLPQLVVITSDLECAIAEARLASDNLGIGLNQDGTDPSKLRADAVKGLDALITQLREAKLNDQAKRLA